jgi:peptidoglycan/xylan/chitin deacetylase (PgdA/CDA1 family)
VKPTIHTGDLPILMYHRICSDGDRTRSGYVVEKTVFRSHMGYLHRHRYYTPRFSDVLSGSLHDNPGGKRPVVLTFDDGYLDNYENAFPILAEFGFTALVFLVSDFSRRKNWWDAEADLSQAPLMNVQQMAAMKVAGIEIGSHSFSHRSLVGLTDDELNDELVRSRRSLEDALQQPATFLAYPYGDVDERVKIATREAGYSCGFAGESGPLHYQSDLYEIRRVKVGNHASDTYLFYKVFNLDKFLGWGRWTLKRSIGLHNAYHLEAKRNG